MDGIDLSLLDPALPKDTSEGDRVRAT